MNAKKFPTKKGYRLWLDQPQAIVEILDYTPNSKKKNAKIFNPWKRETLNAPEKLVKEQNKS